jgi:hypothetical protein
MKHNLEDQKQLKINQKKLLNHIYSHSNKHTKEDERILEQQTYRNATVNLKINMRL